MGAIKWITLVVFVGAVASGAIFGLLSPGTQSADQTYSFVPSVIQVAAPVACLPIPRNYSNWLEIQVVGNRTGIFFQQVEIYNPADSVRVDVPLNETSYVAYRETNSSLASIFVPLPDYYAPGDCTLDYSDLPGRRILAY